MLGDGPGLDPLGLTWPGFRLKLTVLTMFKWLLKPLPPPRLGLPAMVGLWGFNVQKFSGFLKPKNVSVEILLTYSTVESVYGHR